MGALISKVPTKEDMVYELLRKDNTREAAELMFRYFIEEKVKKLEPTLQDNLSQGKTLFSVTVLENTVNTKVLFKKIMEKHVGVFDSHILFQTKLSLAAHDVALKVHIDMKEFKLQGTVLTKM